MSQKNFRTGTTLSHWMTIPGKLKLFKQDYYKGLPDYHTGGALQQLGIIKLVQ